MTKQFSIQSIILWLFVIVVGISIGAGIYESRVLVPLWSAAPPDTVIAYYQHNAAYPQFAPDQGGRFWIFASPLAALLTAAMLISAYWTSGSHRKWRLAAAVLALIAYVATFAWFVPGIIRLSSSDVLTMNRDDVASLATWWVNLNTVRVFFMTTAWIAALRAMTLPSMPDKTPIGFPERNDLSRADSTKRPESLIFQKQKD
jgi:hypothetical protein